MALVVITSSTDADKPLHGEASPARTSPDPGTLVADLNLVHFKNLLKCVAEGYSDSAGMFGGLPSQLASLLNDAAFFVGPADYASLLPEQQRGLCTALLSLVNEAPAAFARFAHSDSCPDQKTASSNARCAISATNLRVSRIRRRVLTRSKIMSESRSVNSHSPSVDFLGLAMKGPAVPSFTLADMLRAAIDGKVSPATVFQALPKNLAAMIDDASRQVSQADFLKLSGAEQQVLLKAILDAVSGTKPPTAAPDPLLNSTWKSTSLSTSGSKSQPTSKPTLASNRNSQVAKPRAPASDHLKERQPATPSPVTHPWWKFW